MKASIHPEYQKIKVICSCGETFETRSTLNQDLNIEVCSCCHPFYTGKQKLVDTGGRVQKFRDRYSVRTVQPAAAAAPATKDAKPTAKAAKPAAKTAKPAAKTAKKEKK